MARSQGSFYTALGRNIRQSRTRAGLTQSALAEVIGMTRTSITNIEQGRQPVYVDVLVQIARATDTSCEKLLSDTTASMLDVTELIATYPAEQQVWIKNVLSAKRR